MFRQLMKLRQARRAFQAGRYRDALQLTGEPDIREHLKAQKLRDRCIQALSRRAADREERGEFTLAMQDLESLRLNDDDAADSRERHVQDMKRERDDDRSRLRSRLYRARLDVERGDLPGARDQLEGIPAGRRTDEMEELLVDISRRMAAASEAVGQARKTLAKDPAEAERLLGEAADKDPRAEGLRDTWRDLARARVQLLESNDLSDGALSAFLLDWGLFKRRNLVEGSELTKLDRRLAELTEARAQKLLERGKINLAETLLMRGRDVLGPAEQLDAVTESLEAYISAREAAEGGDFAAAESHLERCRSIPSSLVKDLRKRLRELSKGVEPRVVEAEELFKNGDLSEAKMVVLGALETAPGHRGARRLLDLVNARLANQQRKIARARDMIEGGRYDVARDALLTLQAERCSSPEIALLLRELEVRATRPPSGATQHQRPDSPTAAAAGDGPLKQAWLLSVEEHGEFLVVEKDRVEIGSAVGGSADIRVLSRLGARHAAISRKVSFHGGVGFVIEALDGRAVTINGNPIEKTELADGDVIQLGDELRLTFRYPSSRSRAALLDLPATHLVEGTSRIVLLPPVGRAGAIVVGESEAHAHGFEGEGACEIYRASADEGGAVVAQGQQGVSVDGDEPRAKAEVFDGSYIIAGELRMGVRNVSLGAG